MVAAPHLGHGDAPQPCACGLSSSFHTQNFVERRCQEKREQEGSWDGNSQRRDQTQESIDSKEHLVGRIKGGSRYLFPAAVSDFDWNQPVTLGIYMKIS